MKLFPPESASKIGLDVVFDWLVERVAGEATLPSSRDMRAFATLEEVRRELKTVDELQQCQAFDDPVGFREFEDIRPSLARAMVRGAALEPLELRAVAGVIDLVVSVRAYFLKRRALYPLVSSEMVDLSPDESTKTVILNSIADTGEILDSASQELRRIRNDLVRARNRVREAAMRALAKASANGYAAEEQPTIRGGRLVIPVRAEAKRKVSGFVHDVSASGQTVYIEPESALQGNNEVRELESEEQREIMAIRIRLTDSVRLAGPDIKKSFSVLTKFDLQWTKARLGNAITGSVPEVGDEGIIRINEGRNPALMLHFLADNPTRTVIPFSLRLGEDDIVLVISGPNAGGKSVTMKSVGLMALMIAHGIPIPVGDKTRFDLFREVYTDIGDEQSLSDDLSTFTSHLGNLSTILNHADQNSLVLIDEAGTGTDPEAGGAIARATLEKLLQQRVRTIVTTHFGPLKVFAHQTEGVSNGSMSFDQAELRPTYTFISGIPGSSYAAEIAQRVGLHDSVIARAKELMGSGHTNAESLIGDLMERNARLNDILEKTELLKTEVSSQREALAKRIEALQSERNQIKAEALREAEDIVQSANRLVEQAVRQIKESGAEKSVTFQARKQIEETRSSLQKELDRTTRKKVGRAKGGKIKTIDQTFLSVGDKVRLEDAQTVGDVVELDDKEAMVAFGSMQMRVKTARLIRVGKKGKQEVRVKQSLSAGGQLSVHSVQTRLDIRGQRVDEALSEVMPFLDRALGAGVDRVEVVHGKGTGALRLALQEYLESARGVVRFEEAPLSQGGAGVTIVHFQ